MTQSNEAVSRIVEGDAFNGDYETQGSLIVEGRFEGTVRCNEFILAPTGHLSGTVEAASARLAGRLTGDVYAHGIACLKTSCIDGHLWADRLAIEPDAKISAKIETSEIPDDARARFRSREIGATQESPGPAIPAGGNEDPVASSSSDRGSAEAAAPGSASEAITDDRPEDVYVPIRRPNTEAAAD